MNAQELAGAAFATVLLDGLNVDQAIASVCARYGVTPDDVVVAVRSCRYLVFHSKRSGALANALMGSAPSGVIPIPYGFEPDAETAQQRLANRLGIYVTHLPSLVVYSAAHVVLLGEELAEVPAGYHEVRLAPGMSWLDGDAPADRARPASEWALYRTPPEFVP